MVAGYEKTDEERIKDLEVDVYGADHEGAEPGIAGKVDAFARFIVYADPRIKDHEERLAAVEERKREGLRNWLKVDDKDTAQKWLDELGAFVEGTLDLIEPVRLTNCWLWHPRVVVELLAVQAHVEGVYKQSSPPALADLLGRHLQMYATRIESRLEQCRSASCHVSDYPKENGHEWKVDEQATEEYVQWWCTTPDRRGKPPGLMPA